MTIQEIIDEAATIYDTSRLEVDQIKSIARIQKRLFTKLGRDSNQYTIDSSDVTVADQEEYTLPSGCKIHTIVNNIIQVETSSTSSKYDDFEYKELDQIKDYGKFYVRGSTSSKYYLFEDGSSIKVSDRTIKIKFYKYPTIIDSVDDIPSLEEEFHDYFTYALVAENASCGEDPDDIISNRWRQEADEYFSEIRYKIDEDLNSSDSISTDIKEIM